MQPFMNKLTWSNRLVSLLRMRIAELAVVVCTGMLLADVAVGSVFIRSSLRCTTGRRSFFITIGIESLGLRGISAARH